MRLLLLLAFLLAGTMGLAQDKGSKAIKTIPVQLFGDWYVEDISIDRGETFDSPDEKVFVSVRKNSFSIDDDTFLLMEAYWNEAHQQCLAVFSNGTIWIFGLDGDELIVYIYNQTTEQETVRFRASKNTN
jgi:hypothetical protein